MAPVGLEAKSGGWRSRGLSEAVIHRSLPAGLAMLELVLALPILLLMMALIINFATFAAWKVRALASARHSAWSSRWPWDGGRLPRPEYWPLNASLGSWGWGTLDVLDDPRLNHSVIRGPMPNGFVVREWLFHPGRGVLQGSAEMSRRFPLVSSLGSYRLSGHHRVLDRFWDHREMGLFTTHDRRTPVLYELPRAPQSYSEAYRQAALAILTAPFRPHLAPLDRDEEFVGYARRFGWRHVGAPDFHPPLRRFCSLDHGVAQERVSELIDDIQGQIIADSHGNLQRVGGVPQRIVEAFIYLYGRVIQELQQQLAAGVPQDVALSIQAEINDLQNRIDMLQGFLNELRNAID